MTISALLLLAALAKPATCVHNLDTERPTLTAAEQDETRRIIRAVVAEVGGSRDFAKFLVLVAQRESSLQRGLVHRLAPDVEGSAAAWRRTRDLYPGNPWADDASRWQTFGLFGMNSNYFTRVWDATSDPEILCDAVVDVLVYQRAAARIVAKLRRSGACAPTWANVHAAVSSGKLCPGASRVANFRRRAMRAGLDPSDIVTGADLGKLATNTAAAHIRLRVNSHAR